MQGYSSGCVLVKARPHWNEKCTPSHSSSAVCTREGISALCESEATMMDTPPRCSASIQPEFPVSSGAVLQRRKLRGTHVYAARGY